MQRRRGGVREADVLHAGADVVAGILGFPGAVDASFASAVGRRGRIGEGDGGIPAAVVGGRGTAGVARISRVTTRQNFVSRASDDRRGGVCKGDVLHAGADVVAGILGRPGAVDAGFASAVGRRGHISEGYGRIPATVV